MDVAALLVGTGLADAPPSCSASARSIRGVEQRGQRSVVGHGEWFLWGLSRAAVGAWCVWCVGAAWASVAIVRASAGSRARLGASADRVGIVGCAARRFHGLRQHGPRVCVRGVRSLCGLSRVVACMACIARAPCIACVTCIAHVPCIAHALASLAWACMACVARRRAHFAHLQRPPRLARRTPSYAAHSSRTSGYEALTVSGCVSHAHISRQPPAPMNS